eukprot:6186591-Prymnesium_polylepis.1
MGRCAAWRLAAAGERVILLDELNPLRGSWGETRASHLAMEVTVLLQMGIGSSKPPSRRVPSSRLPAVPSHASPCCARSQ